MSIDCLAFQQLTAWPCRRATGAHGEDVTVLAPPVSFWDGALIPVYVFDRGEQIEITDDGGLIEHLDASGFDVGKDRRRRRGLEKAVAKWNVSLTSELQLWCKPSELSWGINRYLAALFEVAHWESENAGKSIDNSLLIAEAEGYLRILRPASHFTHDVGMFGISGRPLTFPLKVDATYFDAVAMHPASSASVIKKLFDVRSVRENRDADITVVVEDRTDMERAKSDIQILTQLAHVNRVSELRAEALATLPLRH